MEVVGVPDVSEFDLWHQGLGHPSEKVVKMLPVIHSSTSRKKSNNVYNVYPIAKQTRESFPVSSNKASSLFELIHCDL